MSTATYTIRRNQNLHRHQEAVMIGPISAAFTMLAVLVLLALLYLSQITKTNVFGLRVSNLNKERLELVQQKQNLEIEAARLQSIQHIQNSPVASTMVPVKNPSFVR